jgi:hypothetical protein
VRTFVILVSLLLTGSAVAPDIRGLENCSAEKQMERRTGCLQTNVEFLQQAIAKMMRETQAKLMAANADIAALKTRVTKLENDITQLKAKPKPEPEPAKPESGKK